MMVHQNVYILYLSIYLSIYIRIQYQYLILRDPSMDPYMDHHQALSGSVIGPSRLPSIGTTTRGVAFGVSQRRIEDSERTDGGLPPPCCPGVKCIQLHIVGFGSHAPNIAHTHTHAGARLGHHDAWSPHQA